jgi:hypothetical protein
VKREGEKVGLSVEVEEDRKLAWAVPRARED